MGIITPKYIALILVNLCGLSESGSIRATAPGRGYNKSIITPASIARTPAEKQKPPLDIKSSLRGSPVSKVGRSESISETHLMASLAYDAAGGGGIVRKGCPAKFITPNIVQAAAHCYVPSSNSSDKMKVI